MRPKKSRIRGLVSATEASMLAWDKEGGNIVKTYKRVMGWLAIKKSGQLAKFQAKKETRRMHAWLMTIDDPPRTALSTFRPVAKRSPPICNVVLPLLLLAYFESVSIPESCKLLQFARPGACRLSNSLGCVCVCVCICVRFFFCTKKMKIQRLYTIFHPSKNICV